MAYALALFTLLKLIICGAPHREAVSNLFKVFGMTWPWVDQNPRPPEL